MAHTHDTAPMAPTLADDAPQRQPSAEMLGRLAARRSPKLASLGEPGPTAEELERLLALGLRVPDHGKLEPWRIIVLDGDGRAEAGRRLDRLYAAQNPSLPTAKATMWRDYLERAPLTLVVVSKPDPAAKIPVFHQELSAGALAMNLTVAANALGFSCQWLLKWPGRDPEALSVLGVGEGERVAGFLHIGRPTVATADRPRPDAAAVVSRWRPRD